MAKGIWINNKEFISFSDKQTSLSNEIATRDRSIDFYALNMYLPNPDPVLKKMGKDIKVYNDLMADGHLGGCVSSRKSGVKSLEWEIDRGKSKSRQAKLITDLFEALDLDTIISEILNAPLFGFQALEVIWEQTGNYWLPKAVSGKPQNWFVFDQYNALRLRTRDAWINGEEIPPYKFLLAQHEATYANPYGLGELSRCFWPITFKKGGWKFWVTFAEKFGMPFLIGKLPRGLGKEEYADLADILQSMIQDAIAVIPDDSSVELASSKGTSGAGSGSSDLFLQLIQECKTEISISILGQNLTTEVKGGSFAAAESHMSVRGDIVDSDRKLVERVLNTLVKWIFELNFGDGERPVFGMYQEEDVDKTLAERDELLSKAGVTLTPQYYMREYGFQEGDIASVGAPKPPTPPATPVGANGGSPAQFAEASAATSQTGIDDMVNRLIAEAPMDGLWAPVVKLINESADMQELRDKLLDVYSDMDTVDLGNLMQRAFAAAELLGRFEVR